MNRPKGIGDVLGGRGSVRIATPAEVAALATARTVGSPIAVSEQFCADPAILTHPNIPKPLHGLSPRVLKGQEWWDRTRRAAYASTGYRCLACGVPKAEAQGPKWLEAHEWWRIDYQMGRCEVERIVPLCHWCHNFIHSGRLRMIAGREKTVEECVAILEHGFRILSAHRLPAFFGTVSVAHDLGARTFGVRAAPIPEGGGVAWEDWILVLEGKEYRSNFRDRQAWQQHYQGGGDPAPAEPFHEETEMDPFADEDAETEDYRFAFGDFGDR